MNKYKFYRILFILLFPFILASCSKVNEMTISDTSESIIQSDSINFVECDSLNIIDSIKLPVHNNSSACFIDKTEELWIFDTSRDDGSNYSNIYCLKKNDNELIISRVIKHNLGHCNSIDYNETLDALILGNGSSDYNLSGMIFIIQNVSMLDVLNRSDCVSIDVGFEFGNKVNVVWDEYNFQNAYVICNDTHRITYIKLGFDVTFDGKYEVIKELFNDYVVSDYNNCIQDATVLNYNLIWGWGHANGLSIKIYDMKNNIINIYNHFLYDDNFHKIDQYITGVGRYYENLFIISNGIIYFVSL